MHTCLSLTKNSNSNILLLFQSITIVFTTSYTPYLFALSTNYCRYL